MPLNEWMPPPPPYLQPVGGVWPQGLPAGPDALEAIAQVAKGKKKRKSYSESNLDSLQIIFGVGDPPTVSVTEGEKFLTHFPHLVSGEPFAFSSPKTFIGIESEIENVMVIDPNISTMLWAIKEDGSLRNHGREFVTPGVIPVSLAEPALKLLFGGLNGNIDFSARTSTHIHLDVRQLTLQQLVAFTLAYTAVENLLFKFVGNNRRNNIFCVPVTETGLLSNLGHSPKKFMWAIDSYWSKYTAFNLLPTGTQGSIEFRHMPGTNSIPTLLRWIEMLCRLKTFVYRHDYESIVQTIGGLNSNSRYRQFVELIFGDYIQYLDISNLAADMEKPVYLVKNCSAINPFDHHVKTAGTPKSQLGKEFSSWMQSLSPQQIEALNTLHPIFGTRYSMERFFRELIKSPMPYKKAYPSFAATIDIAITPSKPPKSKLYDESYNELQNTLTYFDTVDSPPNQGGTF